MSDRTSVAVLGATGAVGQRFVQLLANHPWFRVVAVTGSERSAGKSYGEAVRWILPGAPPAEIAQLEVLPTDPGAVEPTLVFSALDARAADQLETAFREAGKMVVSNARSHRWDPDVPLVVPEINPDHLELVPLQQKKYGGAIVTNPNCTTIGLCLALEPLRRRFGLERVMVTSLQALSGAGYPGVPSMDVLDNVLPEISGEEEKVENEPRKIFGRLHEGTVEPVDLRISAQCNRVPTRDGHLLSISVEFRGHPSVEEVRAAIEAYTSPLTGLDLPSAPARPVVLTDEPARPQPYLDRERGGGMVVTVGRLRPCPVLDVRFVALVHNTVRGAAGGTILIAELLHSRGMI